VSDDPLEQLLDLAVFAPLGLALMAHERLPELAERGRQEFESRVPAARFVGQMVFDQGSKEVKRRVDDLPRRVKEVLSGLGLLAACSLFGDDEAGGDGAAGSGPGADPDDARPTSTPVVPITAVGAVDGGDGAPGDAPDPDDLPIPGYDTLSASQVVQRLPGLSPAELDAVRSYEAAGRGRKIVLLKVAQLRAAS
jgi:hypothetical protein